MTETEVALWSAEQVLALATDVPSQRAAQLLVGDSRWSDSGRNQAVVWGRIRGTAEYQAIADLTAKPEFHCSCPSRKVPCKHVLALLLRWAAGKVAGADEPAWVHDWSLRQAALRARREAGAAKPREVNPKTVARRGERVAAGMAELDRWLADQVATGVAGLTTVGYEPFDTLAARLVDAQARGAAGLVRRLATAAVSGDPERLITELGLLRILASGYARIDELPAPLAATVASRVGIPVSREEVLASPPVADQWAVLGVRDEIDDQLSSRRVWLRGCGTGRMAMVLSFAGPGQSLSTDFTPGTTVEADLCFYPGATQLRALVAGRAGLTDHEPPADTIAEALDAWATALAGDPWIDRWPVLIRDVHPTLTHLVEADGTALPLRGEHWQLIGAAGGRPCRVMGEYGPAGLRPVSAWVDGRLVDL
ncbi:SWIM zinc finger family protein [Virgisporangium ochraceum]